MAAVVLCLVFLLAITDHSSATYCVCKDGLGDSVFQKNIDYACGAGADCSAIMQNGACYNPNTVHNHCNYAVNSYYQRKNQATGSCDFSGTATTSLNISSQPSGCVYPASPSAAGTTTSSSPTATPSTPSTGSTSTTPPSVFGLGPTGSGGITNTNSKATVTLHPNTHLFCSFALTLFFSGPMFFF